MSHTRALSVALPLIRHLLSGRYYTKILPLDEFQTAGIQQLITDSFLPPCGMYTQIAAGAAVDLKAEGRLKGGAAADLKPRSGDLKPQPSLWIETGLRGGVVRH